MQALSHGANGTVHASGLARGHTKRHIHRASVQAGEVC
jgi:hypothetical protein